MLSSVAQKVPGMIIDIYGLSIEVNADSPGLSLELIRPFKFFRKDGIEPKIKIIIKEEAPPYESFPRMESKFSTPRNVVYKDKHNKVIDYFGKGAVLEDNKRNTYTLYGRDRNFLLEAFYLLITSLFGQFCDRNNILRIHALGVSYRNKAFIFMMLPGGGKSTMALSLLEDKDIKLISDDCLLFDDKGRVLPFPSRMGFLGKSGIKNIPGEFIYDIDRMEFGPKHFVDYDYFKDRIERRPISEVALFAVKKILNADPEVKKTSKAQTLKFLIRDSVIGLGLYQGIEFIFSSSPKDIFIRIWVTLRRLIRAVRLACKCRVYEVILSRDVAKNSDLIKDFIHNIG